MKSNLDTNIELTPTYSFSTKLHVVLGFPKSQQAASTATMALPHPLGVGGVASCLQSSAFMGTGTKGEM